MTATARFKKTKEARRSQKEACTFQRIDRQPQLITSNKMTHYYFKVWKTGSGILKKIYYS